MPVELKEVENNESGSEIYCSVFIHDHKKELDKWQELYERILNNSRKVTKPEIVSCLEFFNYRYYKLKSQAESIEHISKQQKQRIENLERECEIRETELDTMISANKELKKRVDNYRVMIQGALTDKSTLRKSIESIHSLIGLEKVQHVALDDEEGEE